ncbi:MAG: enoyl-CoA hydratase/isomerase family protein [Rhodoferax sp.]|nr:enoyl-CoA hydratase/isomerase family protein [Rhodoferax sp.]
MGYETLLAEQQGPVLQLTLNRPALRNAMSLQMVAELRQALADAEASGGSAHAVRVVVLRGAGGHFCAGADLKDMSEARMRALQSSDGSDAIADANAQFGALCLAYARTPLAVVALLEGTVMGGGLGLACVADVALASDTAVFRLPETAMGVVPAQIAPFLVERLGYSQAKRLAVTGGKLDAVAALQIGLVHSVSPTTALDTALDAVLRDILACAPQALAATKALMAQARHTDAQGLVQQAAQVFSASISSAEGLEGITAFMQRRKPQWAVL